MSDTRKAAHTPGPWHTHSTDAIVFDAKREIVWLHGLDKTFTPQEAKANAELIVRAVNSHAQLLAAAEAALADLEGALERGDLGDEGPNYNAAKLTVVELQAAISAARGQNE